jgi:hypothetical protein
MVIQRHASVQGRTHETNAQYAHYTCTCIQHLCQLHKVLPVKAFHARAVQEGQVNTYAARHSVKRRAGLGAEDVFGEWMRLIMRGGDARRGGAGGKT